MGCLSCSSIKQLAIPGVSLPHREIFSNYQTLNLLTDLTPNPNNITSDWIIENSIINNLNGSSKFDNKILKEFQNEYINEVLQYKQFLPNNYEYFGTENNEKNLTVFLKNNPFFSSALISKTDTNTGKNYYEIITNAITSENKTWFSDIIDCLDPIYFRVNAKLDENFNIIQIEGYQNGLLYIPSDNNDLYSCLLFLFFYYTECIHAIIHVYHLVLVAGLADSIHHSITLAKWGKQYYPNVYVKYLQVEKLLMGDLGILVGGDFKADKKKLLDIFHELIKVWGNCKNSNEFINNFLLNSCIKNQNFKIESSGLIEEFRKQSSLSIGYAEDLTSEFLKINNGKDMEICNHNFKNFFPECGSGVFKIENLKQWIELMSTTGILHGFTLSFTRLIFKPSILKLFRTNEDYYNELDIKTIKFFSSTIIGATEDTEVYSEKLLSNDINSLEIKMVVKMYHLLSDNLKLEHYNRIKKLPDFSEIGWILTDCGVSGIDGKQMTITSYI